MKQFLLLGVWINNLEQRLTLDNDDGAVHSHQINKYCAAQHSSKLGCILQEMRVLICAYGFEKNSLALCWKLTRWNCRTFVTPDELESGGSHLSMSSNHIDILHTT
jgi:hypothetical protein